MKNVDELQEKYYNAYKNDYDTDDVLKEAKKKLTTNSLNCLIKQIGCQNQMRKQNFFLRTLKIEKKVLIKGDS